MIDVSEEIGRTFMGIKLGAEMEDIPSQTFITDLIPNIDGFSVHKMEQIGMIVFSNIMEYFFLDPCRYILFGSFYFRVRNNDRPEPSIQSLHLTTKIMLFFARIV